MTPHQGNTILFRSFQQLPRLRLGTLEGLFELTRRPSQALDSPRARHRQQQQTQTLIVRWLKSHFFTPILDFEKSTENN